MNCVPELPASQTIWPIKPMSAIFHRGGLHCGRHTHAARRHSAGTGHHAHVTGRRVGGGNCTNRGATRRRHAVARLLMLQNPPPLPEQSQVAAPMSARTRPRHPLTRSRGSHTQARDAVFAGTRHTPPTKTSTFLRDKAETSPFQQHDLSILIVDSNQLKYRLSPTTKPNSHTPSNT